MAPLLLFLYPLSAAGALWVASAWAAAAWAFGLHMKYRTRFGVGHRFGASVLLVSLLHGTGVGLVSTVLAIARRTDLLTPALWAYSSFTAVVSLAALASGTFKARKALAKDAAPQERDWLTRTVDLDRFAFNDQGAPPPATGGWVGPAAFGGALAANVYLLVQTWGSFLLTLVVVIVTLLLATLQWGCALFFQSFARDMALWQLERTHGKRFITSRLDEVRALRRTFWLGKWLCRPEDLTEPPSVPSKRGPTRQVRRRLEAAQKRQDA